jgi:hypothetical protein
MSVGTMLFNPFTGKPRDPRDITSDPRGLLLWDDEMLLHAALTLPAPPPITGPKEQRPMTHQANAHLANVKGYIAELPAQERRDVWAAAQLLRDVIANAPDRAGYMAFELVAAEIAAVS